MFATLRVSGAASNCTVKMGEQQPTAPFKPIRSEEPCWVTRRSLERLLLFAR